MSAQKIIEDAQAFNKRMEDNQNSRNYQTGTLYQLLCDRYDLHYHVNKQKLIDLVAKELDI
jgi:hypothetical protein